MLEAISEGEEVLGERRFYVPGRSHLWEKEETVLTPHGQQTEMVSVEEGVEMDLRVGLVSTKCLLSQLASKHCKFNVLNQASKRMKLSVIFRKRITFDVFHLLRHIQAFSVL